MQSVGQAQRYGWRGNASSAGPLRHLPTANHPAHQSRPQFNSTASHSADVVYNEGKRPPAQAARSIQSPRTANAGQLPRGMGARRASLVMAAISVALFAVASLGGTRLAPTGSFRAGLDRIAAASGLAIRDITITGHVNTLDSGVYAAIDGLRALSLVGFDTRAARLAVEKLAWVESASVSRAWPDRIIVEVRERQPAAVWRYQKAEILIDATGHQLASVMPGVAAGLPVVVGEGAPEAVGDLLLELLPRPELAARIAYIERIGGRRWTLVTHSRQRVLLPAGYRSAIGAALDRLNAGRDGERLIDRAFTTLDLRMADRPVLSDAGKEARS